MVEGEPQSSGQLACVQVGSGELEEFMILVLCILWVPSSALLALGHRVFSEWRFFFFSSKSHNVCVAGEAVGMCECGGLLNLVLEDFPGWKRPEQFYPLFIHTISLEQNLMRTHGNDSDRKLFTKYG